MLYLCGIAYSQDKFYYIEKGEKTFTVSSTGDSFNWFLNGSKLTETSGVYTSSWTTGNYLLSILPYKGGCAGDTFYISLIVKDSITSGGAQVMFTVGSQDICPSSDAVPSSTEIIVSIKFYGDTLKPGESYKFSYAIDDNEPIMSDTFTIANPVIVLPTLDWDPGVHMITIKQLRYGHDFENVVDYSTSKYIPTMRVQIKSVPPIGEIEF
jgi:hypothetical protein